MERVTGGWELDSTDLPDVEASLDSAVVAYPPAWKDQVRARLELVLKVPATLRLGLAWPRVELAYDGGSGIPARPDGTVQRFEDDELGETIQLRTSWKDGALVGVYAASDGIRTDSLAIEAEGERLVLVQTTDSETMSRPLVLRMSYRRR